VKRLLAACLMLAACAPARTGAGPARDLGVAPCVVASLLVQAKPAQGESQTVTVRIWAAPEASLLKLKKLDHDVLEALVQPDGAWQAWLPRERVRAAGTAADAPGLLADLRLLLDEARLGPVGAGIELDAEGFPSARSQGDLRIAYARWTAYGALWRPARADLRRGDDTTIVLLKAFDAPGAISGDRLRLTAPADIPVVPVAEFAQRMP
jgi:hypothetical protein